MLTEPNSNDLVGLSGSIIRLKFTKRTTPITSIELKSKSLMKINNIILNIFLDEYMKVFEIGSHNHNFFYYLRK